MPDFEVTAAPPPSQRQIMLARESTSKVATLEDLSDSEMEEGSKGKVRHTTDGRVTLWQPWRDRWIPKTVSASASNLENLFDAGWRTECGNCGTNHGIQQDARKGADINACPKVPRLGLAYCPTCGARFHDPGMTPKTDAEPDPAALNLYATSSTPESRIRAQLDLHILTYHPADAAGYGIVDSRPAPRAFA